MMARVSSWAHVHGGVQTCSPGRWPVWHCPLAELSSQGCETGAPTPVPSLTCRVSLLQELTTKMVADGTYLLWDLLIFHVYRR